VTEVTIIGGGIVGLATARALVRSGVTSIQILEKEARTAQHQSSHNSGVLHAGLQYQPGSRKAELARSGIREMTTFCRAHNIPHEICGKLVVATDRAQLPRLEEMLQRGLANGLEGLRRLTPEEAREIEPHVECVAALHVPEEGIVDYPAVCDQLEADARAAGVDIVCDAQVTALRRERSIWTLDTTSRAFQTRVVVNCAGLYSDRIVSMAGGDPRCRIVPFRGEYFRLREDRAHLVKHLIYPLPEPGFPFLGVHFTRRIGGGVDAGPNAVLALAREGYDWTTFSAGELAEALMWPGLWRFLLDHPQMVAREVSQSLLRSRFVATLQRLVPEVVDADLVEGHAGVRAQAIDSRGRLLHDFVWAEGEASVHAINSPSPAATASLAIGREIASRVLPKLG
jgi:L-2-hydroxyglutarate oxidase